MDLTPEQRAGVLADMKSARTKKMANRALIDSAFPTQGSPMPSHMGSQSTAPDKGGDYYPEQQDRSLYNQFD